MAKALSRVETEYWVCNKNNGAAVGGVRLKAEIRVE